MTWFRRKTQPTVLSSEQGFLELVDRRADLSLREVLVGFRDLVSADLDWVASRKGRFRRAAGWIRGASLGLTALSTVVLGIEAIPGRAWIALPMVAVVTVLGGLESFFSWRSRWVLMEETQYRFNRLRDEMDFYLVRTPTDQLDDARLEQFFTEQQVIWADVSRRWNEFRKLDRGPRDDQSLAGGA
jgi:hypothetical protein